LAYLSKGGEVGEVEELTGADRMQDRTPDLCIRLVVAQWLSLCLVHDQMLRQKVT
jgi:hypothetical protein